MAEAAPATENNEARRRAMLEAAAELISERGFGETRIADVAKRAGASSALVIYYFGTRDRLLVDALRYSEESFYESAAKMLAEVTGFRDRLSTLVEWCCVPQFDGEVNGAWGLWLDVWATAFRHDEVGEARIGQDRKWRDLVEGVAPRRPGARRGPRRPRRPSLRADLHHAPRRDRHPGRPQGPGHQRRPRLRHRHRVRRGEARPRPDAAPGEGEVEASPRRRRLRRRRSPPRAESALDVPRLSDAAAHDGPLPGLDDDAADGQHQQEQGPAEGVRDAVGEVAAVEVGGVQ